MTAMITKRRSRRPAHIKHPMEIILKNPSDSYPDNPFSAAITPTVPVFGRQHDIEDRVCELERLVQHLLFSGSVTSPMPMIPDSVASQEPVWAPKSYDEMNAKQFLMEVDTFFASNYTNFNDDTKISWMLDAIKYEHQFTEIWKGVKPQDRTWARFSKSFIANVESNAAQIMQFDNMMNWLEKTIDELDSGKSLSEITGISDDAVFPNDDQATIQVLLKYKDQAVVGKFLRWWWPQREYSLVSQSALENDFQRSFSDTNGQFNDRRWRLMQAALSDLCLHEVTKEQTERFLRNAQMRDFDEEVRKIFNIRILIRQAMGMEYDCSSETSPAMYMQLKWLYNWAHSIKAVRLKLAHFEYPQVRLLFDKFRSLIQRFETLLSEFRQGVPSTSTI